MITQWMKRFLIVLFCLGTPALLVGGYLLRTPNQKSQTSCLEESLSTDIEGSICQWIDRYGTYFSNEFSQQDSLFWGIGLAGSKKNWYKARRLARIEAETQLVEKIRSLVWSYQTLTMGETDSYRFTGIISTSLSVRNIQYIELKKEIVDQQYCIAVAATLNKEQYQNDIVNHIIQNYHTNDPVHLPEKLRIVDSLLHEVQSRR